jgi:hypothetical protein
MSDPPQSKRSRKPNQRYASSDFVVEEDHSPQTEENRAIIPTQSQRSSQENTVPNRFTTTLMKRTTKGTVESS